MKYKVTVIQEDEEDIGYEMEAKTHLAIKLRTNKKLEKLGIDIDDCKLKIVELEEEEEEE